MLEKLTHVLKSIRYVQALVFCDQISKCEPIATHLKSSGLDVTFVSSAMSQKDRQLAVDQLRAKRVKILVSSDLTARGIDADNVNLVVNIDAAANEETYFHRIGRAARFGAHGAAVTLLEDERALKGFTALAYRGKVTVKRVVEGVHELPGDLVKNQEFWKDLPYFIDFETPPTGPNDLNKVPDRQSAVESLKSEREASGIVTSSSKKYTRDEMMAMRSDTKNEQSVEEISAKIENLSVETETDEKENVVEVKKTFKERLAELKAAKAAAKSQTEPEAPKSEPKSKFKFVPTREKAKKKYYMRGELQHIREAFTSEQWRAYAETKFDFTEEPFLGGPVESKSAENSQISSSGDVGKAEILENVEKTEQNPPKIIKSRNVQIGSQEDVGNSKNAEKTPLRGSEASKNAENSQISSSGDIGKAEILENGENPVKNPPKTIKYNRFEMKKIQKEVPKDSWIPYVKSKWNTTEEPWELDQWLRCPFEERLRRQRKREKDERRKVIEDRKKRRDEDRQELVSSGRITKVVEIRETSWQDYQARVRREFEEATEKRRKMMTEGAAEVLRRIGPVVPQRTPPLIYRYRVDMYKRRLDEQDAYLQHQNKLDDGILKETEAQTTAENPEKSMEMVEIECQTDEIQEELAEDEEYWDEEYWDEEELEGSEGSQEIFDDFPDVVEELEGSEGSEEASEAAPRAPQLEHLAAGYLRNMNFQAATQSYIDLMNSFARNFGGN
ncbi:Helicase C-terminal domain-containing protein [Caenorhabditis elegans]|nr:Helicase C-terminal domain-containing protein [Caenorhabditis elegans]CCF23355.1 Helicase C-terminal domain-containing protein [Caenorhabditis elegans]|eukprot:NP_001255911.1 Uncharacterized protein CELE_T06A10.1 [Caenorhabditis elegans]